MLALIRNPGERRVFSWRLEGLTPTGNVSPIDRRACPERSRMGRCPRLLLVIDARGGGAPPVQLDSACVHSADSTRSEATWMRDKLRRGNHRLAHGSPAERPSKHSPISSRYFVRPRAYHSASSGAAWPLGMVGRAAFPTRVPPSGQTGDDFPGEGAAARRTDRAVMARSFLHIPDRIPAIAHELSGESR